jgi:hypothetical protein
MERYMVTRSVFVLLLVGCSYDPSFRDCEIACTTDTGCPEGFKCGTENRCRLDGATQTCTAVLGDAGLPDAAPNDSSNPPLDAFACTAHSQCIMMDSSTCCVNPGPTGYCTHGIVIGGYCDPQ